MVPVAATTRSPRSRIPRFLAPAALAALVAAVVLVVSNSPRVAGRHSQSRNSHAAAPKVPPYWTVQPGQTLTEISAKTGLSINQLEAFNPNVDPENLVPGQRLNLWQHPPPPPPKPLGPEFWKVRAGDSLGQIANKTGINLATLLQLNPQWKSAPLQPGDEVRLRH